MLILSAEISQNPLPYQCNNFVYAKVMDEVTTDLQELLADPTVEEGLLPHLVAEFHFARFQTPQLHNSLVQFHQKLDMRMFKFQGAAPKLVEGNFQAWGLQTLEGPEPCGANCMVYPFQIRPCETRARSMHLINLFMYRSETIAAAYEGAGWAFPTKTYCITILLTSVFTIKVLKSYILCTFLQLLFHLNFWICLSSPTGYCLWMLWLMNGNL